MEANYPEALETEAIAKNYHNWIYSFLKPHLGNVVLDAGAGNGYMCKKIETLNKKVMAVEVDRRLLKILRSDLKKTKLVVCDLTSSDFLKLKDEGIDTIISINVLEHIKNDPIVLRNFYEVLRKNGSLLLFVPAMPQIYGSFDKLSGHFRRYTRKDLISKVEKAGFKTIDATYVNFIGFFAWFFTNRILKTSKFSSTAIKVYDFLIPFFSLIEQRIKPPFGQSLFLYAKKNSI